MLIEMPSGKFINPKYVIAIAAWKAVVTLQQGVVEKACVKIEMSTGSILIAAVYETWEEAEDSVSWVAASLSHSGD